MKERIFFKFSIVLFCSFILTPSFAVTYDLVTVGDIGNASDPTTGFGGVSYEYKIGKFSVTVGQYAEFLNAVATTDTYSVYNLGMAFVLNTAGISRSGTSGSYSYTVMNNGGNSGQRPISFVSWFSAARFINWMANGQPVGNQDSSTTENGAYNLNGAISGSAIARNSINPNTGIQPTFYFPLENEWYKAAYYNQTLASGAGGYYLFATQSNSIPGNVVGNAANQANYIASTGYSTTQSLTFNANIPYFTDVGAFTANASYYGTFDQTGNVWEWTDLDGSSGLYRGLRGGAYTSTDNPYMQAWYSLVSIPSVTSANGGFRLVSPV